MQRAVLDVGTELDMEVDVVAGSGDAAPRDTGRSHVTVLAAPLRPEAVAGIAGRIARAAPISTASSGRASYPVTCLELEVSGPIPTCCASSSPPKPSPARWTSPSSARACIAAPSASS